MKKQDVEADCCYHYEEAASGAGAGQVTDRRQSQQEAVGEFREDGGSAGGDKENTSLRANIEEHLSRVISANVAGSKQ